MRPNFLFFPGSALPLTSARLTTSPATPGLAAFLASPLLKHKMGVLCRALKDLAHLISSAVFLSYHYLTTDRPPGVQLLHLDFYLFFCWQLFILTPSRCPLAPCLPLCRPTHNPLHVISVFFFLSFFLVLLTPNLCVEANCGCLRSRRVPKTRRRVSVSVDASDCYLQVLACFEAGNSGPSGRQTPH